MFAILFLILELNPLFSTMDLSYVSDGRVHFRKSGVKRLSRMHIMDHPKPDSTAMMNMLLWSFTICVSLEAPSLGHRPIHIHEYVYKHLSSICMLFSEGLNPLNNELS